VSENPPEETPEETETADEIKHPTMPYTGDADADQT
jgi:hypothetical protein